MSIKHPHADTTRETYDLMLICLPDAEEGYFGYMLDAADYWERKGVEPLLVFPESLVSDCLRHEKLRQLLLKKQVIEVAVFGEELTESARMLIETARSKHIFVNNHTRPGSSADTSLRSLRPSLGVVASNNK